MRDAVNNATPAQSEIALFWADGPGTYTPPGHWISIVNQLLSAGTYDLEFASELYSTSGEWDLLMKLYIPEGQDIGRYINEKILDIPNIERSLTTLTFKAF